MAIIDTSLIELENIQKKHAEISATNPALAAELANKAFVLQQQFQANMAPFYVRMAPWASARA